MALVEKCADNGVTTLTINRPEKRNAMIPEEQAVLGDYLRAAESDDDARVVIITGAGDDFCVGAELAAFCDMVVMSENAFLADPHVKLGLGPAPGALMIWPQLTSAIAAELMLTGRHVPAEEALRLGLANRVVPRGAALTASLELAQEMCDLPLEGLMAVKSALRRSNAQMLAAANQLLP